MMQFVSQIMQKGMKSGYELRKGGYEVRKILNPADQQELGGEGDLGRGCQVCEGGVWRIPREGREIRARVRSFPFALRCRRTGSEVQPSRS